MKTFATSHDALPHGPRFLRRVAAVVLASAVAVHAAPTLAPLFQDHAVLQRDKPVPVWGSAPPGEHVTVTVAGQTIGATTGPDGRWIVVLGPLEANSTGADLTVTGKGSAVAHDVVVGEVWICAGQANMEFTVDDGGPVYRVDNAAAEVAAAHYPHIRQFKVGRQAADAPVETVPGNWKACSPENVGQFTAIGYFFARELFTRLGVPIGIINCTWSGSPIESWMSRTSLAALPSLPGRPAESPVAAAPGQRAPASLFNGMIHPLLPYAIRGAVWYQGESDVGRAADYAVRFPAMITAWRSHFGEGDFPFYWVQLANYRPARDPSGRQWAELREAQSRALSLPATGEAVAIDVGEANNPHPRNKQEVGRRLALIAKANVYSIAEDYSGPLFKSMKVAGTAVRVTFAFAGDGLTASGRPLQSFELAGADRVFHPATALIEGDTVVVRSAAVSVPVAVRYAWTDSPDANLYNGAGLPAAPFRTDSW